MYAIMVYDVGEPRVAKVLKIARKYLTWVQNSVFEGEITEADIIRLNRELENVIDRNSDSINFYLLRTTRYLSKQTLGVTKNTADPFI